MNILNNKNKRISIFKALALCLFAAVSLTLASCDDDMDIQQSYPFTVETMPVPNKVTKGQTVEIRCELKRTGEFANTLYTIRYFQFEGEGTLKMAGGITFLPNDRYLLENDKFRLYYTADGDEAHNFIVVVEDNFKNSYELEFDFNNRNVKDDIQTVIPIGNFKPLPRGSVNSWLSSVRFWRSAPCPHGTAVRRGRTGRRQSTACRLSSGQFGVRSILKAGTRKNITRMWGMDTGCSRGKGIRHAP